MSSQKIITEYGTIYWYKPGTNIYHREDGPAVELCDGSKYWYINGKLHREDGPAIEHNNGSKYWFINGEHHREDGPAIDRSNGSKEYYINGKQINCNSNKEFKRLIKLKVFL